MQDKNYLILKPSVKPKVNGRAIIARQHKIARQEQQQIDVDIGSHDLVCLKN